MAEAPSDADTGPGQSIVPGGSPGAGADAGDSAAPPALVGAAVGAVADAAVADAAVADAAVASSSAAAAAAVVPGVNNAMAGRGVGIGRTDVEPFVGFDSSLHDEGLGVFPRARPHRSNRTPLSKALDAAGRQERTMNPAILQEMLSMGLDARLCEEGCRRFGTVEAALEWVLEHGQAWLEAVAEGTGAVGVPARAAAGVSAHTGFAPVVPRYAGGVSGMDETKGHEAAGGGRSYRDVLKQSVEAAQMGTQDKPPKDMIELSTLSTNMPEVEADKFTDGPPIVAPVPIRPQSKAVNPVELAKLVEMGFTAEQATWALGSVSDAETACLLILSRGWDSAPAAGGGMSGGGVEETKGGFDSGGAPDLRASEARFLGGSVDELAERFGNVSLHPGYSGGTGETPTISSPGFAWAAPKMADDTVDVRRGRATDNARLFRKGCSINGLSLIVTATAASDDGAVRFEVFQRSACRKGALTVGAQTVRSVFQSKPELLAASQAVTRASMLLQMLDVKVAEPDGTSAPDSMLSVALNDVKVVAVMFGGADAAAAGVGAAAPGNDALVVEDLDSEPEVPAPAAFVYGPSLSAPKETHDDLDMADDLEVGVVDASFRAEERTSIFAPARLATAVADMGFEETKSVPPPQPSSGWGAGSAARAAGGH